jgi:hypothetical protein
MKKSWWLFFKIPGAGGSCVGDIWRTMRTMPRQVTAMCSRNPSSHTTKTFQHKTGTRRERERERDERKPPNLDKQRPPYLDNRHPRHPHLLRSPKPGRECEQHFSVPSRCRGPDGSSGIACAILRWGVGVVPEGKPSKKGERNEVCMAIQAVTWALIVVKGGIPGRQTAIRLIPSHTCTRTP